MTSYKIYLTKSHEVARLLFDGCGKQEHTTCSFGPASNNELIPAIYQNEKYFYCSLEYESDTPQYQLIIA